MVKMHVIKPPFGMYTLITHMNKANIKGDGSTLTLLYNNIIILLIWFLVKISERNNHGMMHKTKDLLACMKQFSCQFCHKLTEI